MGFIFLTQFLESFPVCGTLIDHCRLPLSALSWAFRPFSLMNLIAREYLYETSICPVCGERGNLFMKNNHFTKFFVRCCWRVDPI